MPGRALVVSSLSLGTGCGLRARYLAQALRRLRWQVDLLEPGSRPLPLSAEALASLPAYALGANGSYDLAVAIKPYPNAALALGLARLRGALTVCDIDDLDSAYRGPLLGLLTRALQAPARWVSHRLSTHHPLLKEALGRPGAPPVLDLLQGVDLGIFDPGRFSPAARRAWRRSLGLKAEKTLLFAAHLNVACQFEELLARAAGLLGPGRVLVVAGGGPLLGGFKRLAAPLGGRVRFSGTLTPDQVALAMASADAGVSAYGPSPSNRYRVPMKIAEYLAMGLPCATELIPGLLLFKPFVEEASGGAAAFEGAVKRALTGRARAKRGQAWVRRHLGWDHVASRFLRQLDMQAGAR